MIFAAFLSLPQPLLSFVLNYVAGILTVKKRKSKTGCKEPSSFGTADCKRTPLSSFQNSTMYISLFLMLPPAEE
jgi:hypothetical protein